MKLPRFCALILILFALIERKLDAQNLPAKFLKMEAITIRDGLSQGMINCIYQDHFGFMWFGTMDGLNRYDGYNFTVYRYDNNNPYSISGNLISAIFEDSKGRLWVGTGLNGLNLFDRETEKFIRFQTDNKQTNTISSNGILSISEDKFGSIWVGTFHGLNKISIRENAKKNNSIKTSGKTEVDNRYKISITRIQFDPWNSSNELFVNHEETGNNDYFLPSIFVDNEGIIWVSTLQSFFRIRPSKNGIDKIEKMETTSLTPNKLSFDNIENHIYAFAEDTTLHFLYLIRRNYITVLNKVSGKIEFKNFGKILTGVFHTQIILNSGVIWNACNASLYQFDLTNNKVWNIRPKNNDQVNMVNFANTVYQDRTGIIWIGTKGYGILKYNPQTEKFHSVNLPSVLWMSTTPDNNIIVQAKKLLLYRYQDSLRAYTADTNFFQPMYKAMNNRTADLAVQNKEGICWVNITNLVQYDPIKKTIKKFDRTTSFPLFVDDQDNLWFGSRTAFCNLDRITGIIKEYPYPLPKINYFPYSLLEAINYDPAGFFWLGTTHGLFRFDLKYHSWKRFINIPKDNSTLSVDVIFSICKDPLYPEKYLWIGTNGGGMNCFNKITGKFVRYDVEEGLPNKVVYGILNDDSGNLWLSTNKGLSRFTPAYSKITGEKFPTISGGVFKNFQEEDGLQSNEFNRNAFTRTTDGTLFFGGVNGFNYFNPKEISDDKLAPNVTITDFKINNKTVNFSNRNEGNNASSSQLRKPIFLTDEIALDYEDNMISFEFSAMDFTAPEKNMFKYKLEGFDKEWIQSGTNHLATYTNLDPGTYTFNVAGGNNIGVGEKKITSISLVILPPWYMTWWFRIALVFLIVSPLYVIWRYRLKQAVKVLEVRNRIASDLHDEIGSTLSSVYIYSEVAQNSAKKDMPDLDIYLKQISVDVANMIDSLGDIVWTVNAKNDRFENIINRMRASAVELFEARGYQLHLNIDEQLNTLKLGMEARKNFYLFYKEAINNVAKYAEGKNIFIKLEFKKRSIYLSVKDDGKGFDINGKNVGNGLANMKKRAADLNGLFEIITAIGKGTEVKLTFPYS